MARNHALNAQVARNLIEAIDNFRKVFDDISTSDLREIANPIAEEFEDDIEVLDDVEIIVHLAKGKSVCFACGAPAYGGGCKCGENAEIISPVKGTLLTGD